MYGAPVGDVLLTSGTSQAISTSYKARVFNIHLISSGTAGGSIIQLFDNGPNGILKIKETGTASTGKTFDYGINGKLFNNGVSIIPDANLVSVSVSLRQEEAN